MQYGRKGGCFYVNSAQSCSRDRVDEMFLNAAPDGSVPWEYIETLTGGADLVGDWAIRSYIEAHGYSRRAAQYLMREYAMSEARGLRHTQARSLGAYFDARKATIYSTRLQRAGKAAAHLTTDCSSGYVP
jgi:hypothetical protein